MWTSDGQSFVALNKTGAEQLIVVRVDGSSQQTFPYPHWLDYLRRYQRPYLGVRGFVFHADFMGQQFINQDGTQLRAHFKTDDGGHGIA